MTIPAEDPTVLVHAYLDGELDSANALAIERRMASDPVLAAERDRILALRQLIRERLPREGAPPALRSRVERAVGLSGSATPARPRPHSQPSWRSLAASVLVTAMVASGSTFLITAQRPTPDVVTEEVVSGHMRALMAPQPTDVASSDRHTVKPWFNGRIPESPRVVDLAARGFPLVGGRLDVVDRKPVPTLVYHRNKHVISLTAIQAAGRPNAAPARLATDGYNVVRWTEDGVTYFAISDLGAAELDTFVQLFRTTPPDT
jgi:anti-sigma factor RsiW